VGRIRIINASPLTTIQDYGRFGFRKYGIPQSGAIDQEGMQIANNLVANELNAPVIEFALGGIRFEVLERTAIGVFGAEVKVDGTTLRENATLTKTGAVIEIAPPKLVYGYLAIGGTFQLSSTFDSYSTYLPAKLGGLEGRMLRKGDVLHTIGEEKTCTVPSRHLENKVIRFSKGPEWSSLKAPFESKEFQIDHSSNRIGIRLSGEKLECSLSEIKSSAVLPGTIQLPPNGQPIVLLNDCQTTGGYPRIGKVLDEDLGKVGQVKVGQKVRLKLQ